MITVKGLGKTFKVAKRSAGIRQTIKALFHREYTDVVALKDVSFTINKGEIVGYIGPNGAGKSTTIKMMSGILVPDKGQCEIMGNTPWKNRTEHVRNIGVVFGQRTQLWWDVPVIDSFELLKDIYKISKVEYEENLKMLVEALDLKDIINTPVRQLSLGQRMRCEIAASLLHSPKILFLDEPTIGLDAVSKIAVRQFIKKINKEKGVTVILTTHDMQDIEALASRIIFIGKGQILFDGEINELRNKFVTKKTITIDYKESNNKIEIKDTEILSWSPERAVLSVDTKNTLVSDIIGELSKQLELLDVSVENQPIEEIIVKMYEEYQI